MSLFAYWMGQYFPSFLIVLNLKVGMVWFRSGHYQHLFHLRYSHNPQRLLARLSHSLAQAPVLAHRR